MKDKVVIITGASSGVGLATAKYFASKGCKVYGLARKPFEENGIESIICDVTKKDMCIEAVNNVAKKEGKIDLLINNAGFGVSGSIENSSVEDVKRMFDVNFFGAVNMTQAVLPQMRKQGYGKIINTSSVASIIPIPFQSFYSATKSSLDIWAKALRLEVRPFHIQVCNVLLGDTKTGFTAHREKNQADEDSVYKEVVARSVKKMEHDEQHGKDPITASKVMYKMFAKRKMPATKVVGFSYKTIVFLSKILPQRFMLFVVRKLYC